MKYDIFISYRKEKSIYADLICNHLIKEGYSKNRIFLDKHEIHAEQFDKKIELAIEESKCFLMIVSEGCFVSKQTEENEDWFLKEIQTAIENEITIIPLLFDKIESLEDGDQRNLLEQAFTQEESSFLRKQQAVRYDNDYSDASLNRLVRDFLPKPSKEEPSAIKEILLGLTTLVVGAVILFFCIFGIAFGITYLREKPADTPKEELQSHVVVLGQTAYYRHGNSSAAYDISQDSVLYVNSLKSTVPTLSMTAFWSSTSMSTAFSRYMIKISKTSGNPKQKVITMAVGFVAVVFGYSQGEYFATEYCETKRQIFMRDELRDKTLWQQIIERNKPSNTD